ncbi:MAG: HAMP domain-containing histidine kinase [Bacteroidales bacterium]|jgi:signal transduction histidine kinase/predicted DNA binding CopG/RHH family protein|nr:HAMP domain-containing histidine kinase [Bacteroidales bacterium]
MNKKLLYFLIAGICVSLVGIIIVQFFWIQNAMRVKESQFDRGVNDALGSAVNKMETRENMYFISRNFEGDSIMSIVQAFTKDTTQIIKDRLDSLLASNELQPCIKKTCPGNQSPPPPPPPPPSPGVVHYAYHYNVVPIQENTDSISLKIERFFQETPGTALNEFNFKWNDQLALIDSMFESESAFFRLREDIPEDVQIANLEGELFVENPDPLGPRFFRFHMPQMMDPRIVYPHPPNMGRKKDIKENSIQKLDNKARKIQDVIKKMAIELETKPTPIQQRINKKNLQATLTKALADKGIELPFEFAVFSPSNDSNPVPIRSNGFKKEYQSTEHRVSLFPNDLFQKPDLLLVFFPNQKTHVLKSLSLLLFGSILFTIIIIVTSGASIVVMIRQKKISDIKTDFINNMTHEFKTPIATISIAADSINNPKVIGEPATIKNYTRIIKEENNRMNARVEQVLQMAMLDSHDFHLRPRVVDMNYLIEKSVEHFRLQIEKRDGVITTLLHADNPFVEIDEDHMRNVLLNLLDNSNKYSLSKPEIDVFSFNRSGKYYFGVQDKGMGMSAETQRKVFDKFFRLTSGNIHNIKGFGLGLSYVKAIALAHHGEVHISSELGKGSRFEISLPLVPESFKHEHEPVLNNGTTE